MNNAIKFIAGLVFLLSASAHASPADDLFDAVLKNHVEAGVVDYAGINADQRFFEYLDYLADTDPETFASKEEKLAFWINAYNALAIKGILDGRSPSSFFGRIGYFKSADYALAGSRINLYDLERDILVPLGEPRIHFAIVCASASCPILISEVYRAETLDQQLEVAARTFINSADKNDFDNKLRIAKLSKIFDWFEKDFKNHAGSVANYLAGYVQDEADKRTLQADDLYVRYLDYDWSLNGKSVN